jgi:arsenate reductase
MGEGILKAAAGDLFEVHSAGSNPAGFVHPKAITVMQEIGVDISDHQSKSLEPFLQAGIDTIITVCDNANDACPTFPGKVNRYHWGFEDPAYAEGTEDEILEEFRLIRDQIKLVFEAFVTGYRQAGNSNT